MAEGVDLYGLYNEVTDWPAVERAGIEFAWIKLSDGNTNRDDYGYVGAGRSVGIAMGGYHYAQPGDPVAQADRLIGRCLAEGALDLAPALDLEDPFTPNAAAIQFATRFLLRLAERGYVPCLYANNSMLNGILKPVREALKAAGVTNLKVWAARYGSPLTVPYDVHQYTSTGRVPGIAGDVDRNRGDIPWNRRPDAIASTTEEEIEVEKLQPGENQVTQIPCNGKTAMFFGTGFTGTVDGQLWFVGDTQGGSGGNFKGTSPSPVHIDTDRPGPVTVPPGTRYVSALLTVKNQPCTVWCA